MDEALPGPKRRREEVATIWPGGTDRDREKHAKRTRVLLAAGFCRAVRAGASTEKKWFAALGFSFFCLVQLTLYDRRK